MKKNISNTLITILLVVSAFSAACTAAVPAAQVNTSTSLSAEESAALLFMVEEEKLAHDVYTVLAARWNLPVFENIAASEEKHIAEVSRLLSTYNIQSPLQKAGVFTNPELQQLYNQLVAQGSESVAAALKVGANIEEIDIRDLQTRLSQTSKADIKLVFNNLMNASYQHLQAFTSNLNGQAGKSYSAPYSTQNGRGTGGRPTWAGGNH